MTRTDRLASIARNILFGLLLLALLQTHTAQAAPIVWGGDMTHVFSKASGADWTLPENQDRILSDIWLTRANFQGMFNIAQEASYQSFVSPASTAWATSIVGDNGDKAITATNWEQLDFTNWQDAYGGQTQLFNNITSLQAVVRLSSGGNDIYLNLQVTDWEAVLGGAFTYVRSVPEPISAILGLCGLLAWAAFSRTRWPMLRRAGS